jgi:hypothetical protein
LAVSILNYKPSVGDWSGWLWYLPQAVLCLNRVGALPGWLFFEEVIIEYVLEFREERHMDSYLKLSYAFAENEKFDLQGLPEG